MFRTCSLALLVLVGCTKHLGDPPVGDDPTANGLPDPRVDFEHTCEDAEYEGCPLAAATAVFAGDYVFDGDTVSGFEYWWLHPNATLVAAPEELFDSATPCNMVWEVFGTKVTDDLSCTGCAYQLEVQATFDAEASDCAEVLEDAQEDFSNSYDVRAESGDGIRLAFTASGNEFGEGEETSRGMIWASENQCEALGTSECPND